MCGILGFFSPNGFTKPSESTQSILIKMLGSLRHRGPDSNGIWIDQGAGIALGHTRLSIQDLSEAGHQPMISRNERYVLSYNGEIYNAPDLRTALQGLQGHSDTEILIESIATQGLVPTLKNLSGMFAFSLWDKKEKTLTLARDHFGKKPLYVGLLDDVYVFASELKSIMVFAKESGRRLKINQKALSQFTRFGFVPAPLSIYEGVYKLPPAHSLTLGAVKNDFLDGATEFWKLDYNQKKQPLDQDHVEDMLSKAVKSRLISDVPLGAFLSGGIDSSLITALMQNVTEGPIKTYSIGFSDAALNESRHAEKIAAHLGTDHKTYHVGAGEGLKIIPHLPQIYDEPFADYSQIPSVILCQQAKQDTTVALSGDGGDEVFCGYKRYFMLQKLYKAVRALPHPFRKTAAVLLKLPPQKFLNALGLNGKRIHSIAGFVSEKKLQDMILRTLSVAPDTKSSFVLDPDLDNELERMMATDTQLYLPDDILVKVDRASMYSSLEVRSPLLDKDLAEYMWSVQVEDKIFPGAGKGKKPLYDLLCKYVPQNLVDRPKQGFTPPVAQWLKTDLKDWAEDLISTCQLYDRGDTQTLWSDFISAKADHHSALWAILMAESWHKYYKDFH